MKQYNKKKAREAGKPAKVIPEKVSPDRTLCSSKEGQSGPRETPMESENLEEDPVTVSGGLDPPPLPPTTSTTPQFTEVSYEEAVTIQRAKWPMGYPQTISPGTPFHGFETPLPPTEVIPGREEKEERGEDLVNEYSDL